MLYLASKSPRRRALLGLLGVDFEVLDVDVPEQRLPDEAPLDYVRRVARDKALAGLAVARPGDAAAVVIGADTEVILDDHVFGKPDSDADAAAMLRRLSGRTHLAASAVCVVTAAAMPAGATVAAATVADSAAAAVAEYAAVCVSEVTFATLGEATIARYLTTGEAQGKAGAYAIQGAAQAFITHLSGSHSGVMGLPLHETDALLRRAGVMMGAAVAASGCALGRALGRPESRADADAASTVAAP